MRCNFGRRYRAAKRKKKAGQVAEGTKQPGQRVMELRQDRSVVLMVVFVGILVTVLIAASVAGLVALAIRGVLLLDRFPVGPFCVALLLIATLAAAFIARVVVTLLEAGRMDPRGPILAMLTAEVRSTFTMALNVPGEVRRPRAAKAA